MKEKFEAIAIANGYIKKGYGYIKLLNNVTHWITIFDSSRVQLYGYYDDDIDISAYNTEVIQISEDELQVLINIFNRKSS